MRLNLYEWMINEDGKRSPGRQIGLITFKGDGTRGHVEYFDTCNEIWDVRDKNSPYYGTKDVIVDERERKRFKKIFRESVDIAGGGSDGADGSIHYSTGRTVTPWHREGIAYIVKYSIPNALCGNIMTKVIEED